MNSEESVAEALRRVWRDRAAQGSPMPSEGELAEQLGASRNQVREQLIRLEADGLVRREHGAGTFINPAAVNLRFRLDRVRDFAESLREAGYEPTVEVISFGIVDATPEQIERLGIREGGTVVETVKRWFADGAPAMVAHDIVPLRRPMDAVDDPSWSVFELAEHHGRGSADWLETQVSAVVPEQLLVSRLLLDEGTPVIRLDQVGWSKHGPQVFMSVDHYHPEIAKFGTVRTVGR